MYFKKPHTLMVGVFALVTRPAAVPQPRAWLLKGKGQAGAEQITWVSRAGSGQGEAPSDAVSQPWEGCCRCPNQTTSQSSPCPSMSEEDHPHSMVTFRHLKHRAFPNSTPRLHLPARAFFQDSQPRFPLLLLPSLPSRALSADTSHGKMLLTKEY